MRGGAEERRESLAESRMGQQETSEEHPRMMHRKAYRKDPVDRAQK